MSNTTRDQGHSTPLNRRALTSVVCALTVLREPRPSTNDYFPADYLGTSDEPSPDDQFAWASSRRCGRGGCDDCLTAGKCVVYFAGEPYPNDRGSAPEAEASPAPLGRPEAPRGRTSPRRAAGGLPIDLASGRPRARRRHPPRTDPPPPSRLLPIPRWSTLLLSLVFLTMVVAPVGAKLADPGAGPADVAFVLVRDGARALRGAFLLPILPAAPRRGSASRSGLWSILRRLVQRHLQEAHVEGEVVVLVSVLFRLGVEEGTFLVPILE